MTAPFGKNNVITIDMGGTSFDITLVKDGSTNLNKNIDFLRYRIGVPMIQVETLGAGGGSIGWIDSMGLLQVGPQSAGSTPGPACYGQGGVEPTVSDANLVLGYLNPDGLLGGKLPLDKGEGRSPPSSGSPTRSASSVERAAYGMYTIVNSNMVNGIRRVSVERGYDPRDFVLVGAGGATAAHITAIAREMGIDTIILPKLASGLCAFGQIISDVKYNYMATAPLQARQRRGLQEDRRPLRRDRDSRASPTSRPTASTTPASRCSARSTCGMSARCTSAPSRSARSRSTPATIEQVKEAFHKRHEELYTYSERKSPVEVVNIESTLYGHVEKPKAPRLGFGSGGTDAIKAHRPAIFSADGMATNTPVYDGGRSSAPAIKSADRRSSRK